MNREFLVKEEVEKQNDGSGSKFHVARYGQRKNTNEMVDYSMSN